MKQDELIELAKAVGAKYFNIGLPNTGYWEISTDELTKFADLVSVHATALHSEVRSMQTEQPKVIEAVAEMVSDGEGGLGVGWIIEGGASELVLGDVLYASNEKLTDENGYGEVYTHPAPSVTSMQGGSEYSLVRNDVLKFLHGEAELNGVDFSDVVDANEGVKIGKYWWRKYLRDATKPVVDDRVKGVSDSKVIDNAIEFLKYLNTSGLLTGDDKLRKHLVSDMEKSYKELSALQLSTNTDGWVSVDDRFPPKGDWYLVAINSSMTTMAFLDGGDDDGYFWLSQNDYERNKGEDNSQWEDVTHWKLLDAPPINAISQPKGESV